MHSVDAVWHICDVEGCDAKFTRKDWMKKHLKDEHDIGVNWLLCDQSGCAFQAKVKIDLQRHKSFEHGIGDIADVVRFAYINGCYPCPDVHCEYKTKDRSRMRNHTVTQHNQIEGSFDRKIGTTPKD
jgi:hypothetical protein